MTGCDGPYSCRSSATSGSQSRTTAAIAAPRACRAPRWSRLTSTPSVFSRVFAVAAVGVGGRDEQERRRARAASTSAGSLGEREVAQQLQARLAPGRLVAVLRADDQHGRALSAASRPGRRRARRARRGAAAGPASSCRPIGRRRTRGEPAATASRNASSSSCVVHDAPSRCSKPVFGRLGGGGRRAQGERGGRDDERAAHPATAPRGLLGAALLGRLGLAPSSARRAGSGASSRTALAARACAPVMRTTDLAARPALERTEPGPLYRGARAQRAAAQRALGRLPLTMTRTDAMRCGRDWSA